MPDVEQILGGSMLVGGGGALGVAVGKMVEAFMRGRTPKKDVMTAVAAAAEQLMDGMRQDLDALRRELAAQKAAHSKEIEALRSDHAEREAACDRRLDELAGQLRQSRQEVASLLRQLRDPASTEPGGALEGAVIQLRAGGATVVSNTPGRNSK